MASAHARYNKSKQDKPSFKCGREESNGVFNRRKGAAEPSALLDHRESQEAPCPTFISMGNLDSSPFGCPDVSEDAADLLLILAACLSYTPSSSPLPTL